MTLETLKGARVLVDGYNVLITAESLIGGMPVYRCDDDFLRDVRGIFKGYKVSELTGPAISAVFDLIAGKGLASVDVLLDQQMSQSGELAETVRSVMDERGIPGTAVTERNVDRMLKAARDAVATGDGNIIDSVSRVVDIPGEIAVLKGIEVLSL